MCLPALAGAGWVAYAATAASAVVGAYASVQSAKARNNEAQYNAAVSEQNRELAERNRPAIVEQSETEQRRLGDRAARAKSEITSQFSAMGFDPGFGSPDNLVEGVHRSYDIDRVILAENESQTLYANELEGRGYSNEAALARQRGRAALQAGSLEAAGSLLSGASKVADRWSANRPRTNTATIT